MDCMRQAKPFRNPLQQVKQLRPLLRRQPIAYGVIVFASNRAQLLQGTASGLRKVERVHPSVRRADLSRYKPPLLKRVDYTHQPAGMHLQPRGELLLADAFALPEHAQHAGMLRHKVKRGQPLSKPRGRLGPDLCEQESYGGWSGGLRPIHVKIIKSFNDYFM